MVSASLRPILPSARARLKISRLPITPPLPSSPIMYAKSLPHPFLLAACAGFGWYDAPPYSNPPGEANAALQGPVAPPCRSICIVPHGVGADEFASLREFCARWRGGLGWGELGKARPGGRVRERGAGRVLGSGLGDWEIGRLGDWEIGRLGDWEIRFCDRVGDAWYWKSGAEILVVASSKSYVQNYFGEGGSNALIA